MEHPMAVTTTAPRYVDLDLHHDDRHGDASCVVSVDAAAAGPAIVKVDGEVDLATQGRLEEAIRGQIGAGHDQLLIDLSGTTFLSSSAIGALLRSLAPLRHQPSAAVVIVAPSGFALRTLQLNGAAGMFSLFDTRDEAVAAFGAADRTLVDAWRLLHSAPTAS
jgi:anti-sigma B factor antagonist